MNFFYFHRQDAEWKPLLKVLLRIQVYNNSSVFNPGHAERKAVTDETEARMLGVLFDVRTARAYNHIITLLSNKQKI